MRGLGVRDVLCLCVDDAVEQKARQSHTPLCMRGVHACVQGVVRAVPGGVGKKSGQDERQEQASRASNVGKKSAKSRHDARQECERRVGKESGQDERQERARRA